MSISKIIRSLWGNKSESFLADECVEISANIDDMTPQDISVMMNVLLRADALDVWFENIQMKKNRPAFKLCALATSENSEQLAKLILKHTTTLGVRMNHVERRTLQRKIDTVDTSLGKARLKRAFGVDIEKQSWEFDDILRIAEERGMSIAEVRIALAREEATFKDENQ